MREEEQVYKIYDSMCNVIGVEGYEKVHREGLLHQVVHFWLLERENGQSWLYMQKRPDDDPVYQGAFDILTSGHIEPEQTHEDALVGQIHRALGLDLKKEQITFLGNIHQQIDVGDYHDNAFAQVYIYETEHPKREFSGAERVVKVKYEDLKRFTGHTQDTLEVYTKAGDLFCVSVRDQWWRRMDEFTQLVVPFLDGKTGKKENTPAPRAGRQQA